MQAPMQGMQQPAQNAWPGNVPAQQAPAGSIGM
jgi:hypothetical protein